MKKSCSILLALALGVGISAAAMAVSVAGTVAGSQGQSFAGAQIIVKDASGHVVGQGTIGSNGAYDISGLPPGNYNFTLAPGSSGIQGETVASYVGADGICLNWGVSTTSPAVATAQPGSACQPLAGAGAAGGAGAGAGAGTGAAGGWDTAATVGTAAGVLGAGAIAAAVVVGTEGNNHKTSKSTGQ